MSVIKEEIENSIDNVKADTYCEECDSQFCNHSALQDHKILMHNSTENPWNVQSLYDLMYFNCPSCTYKNNFKQEFVDHAYNFHPESSQYLTNISDGSMTDVEIPNEKSLDFKYDLENGFSNGHGGMEIKVEEFDDDDYDDVTNSQSPENDREYRCNQCEKVCQSKNDLNFHYSTEHQDLKMFACNHCEKSFSTSKKLVSHVKIHNSNVSKEFAKDYKCDFYLCEKSFSYGQALKNHIQTVHEGHKD